MAARTELIADRGAAAETADFFRSQRFYAAEGVTHTLVVAGEGVGVRLPLIVRAIPDSYLEDGVSPYGYPGAAMDRAAPPPDPARVDWSGAGLVSVFVRDRIGGEPCLASPTRRSVVQVHDPALPRRLRSRFAEQIRGVARRGYAIEVVRGPDASRDRVRGFAAAYGETMRRAAAAPRYLYEDEYFRSVLDFEGSWLVLARAPDGEIAAGAIAGRSDGLVHYYLGGTADAHLARSPFKQVVDRMCDLADELDIPLNLGGGVRTGDGLEDFKRGFANRELDFRTHEIVCDPGAYAELSSGREAGDFFPAYRAPTR